MTYRTEEEATRGMLASDADWPNIVLPVKNRLMREEGGWPKMGVVKNPGEPVTIIVTNMFLPPPGSGETLTYPTVDAAMAAGWVVD